MVIQQLVAKYQRRKWLSKSEQIKMQGAIFFSRHKSNINNNFDHQVQYQKSTNQKVE